ncbi:MAG: hypothetical protein IJ870_03135 [Alphaproteobacteria bacterium]|nr:hypothetical protein [Alphaproteobacteria bacterium]
MTDEKENRVAKRAPDGYRTITYQVDTLSSKANAAAYYQSRSNAITSNYVIGQDNTYNQSDEVLIHEQKHRSNQEKGLYAYAVNSEQAYKLQMHDEISATMASIIASRQKYLETGDISVFDNNYNAKFYADAIKNGEVNPFSDKKEDFDKEMHLIMNGTQKFWCEKKGLSDTYMRVCATNGCIRAELDGKHAAFYDENYERGKKICYNIGGVDFTQYMDHDVEIPAEGQNMLNAKINDKIQKTGYEHLSHEDLAMFYDVPVYDGKMSLQQYQDLVQQTLAMNKAFNINNSSVLSTGETVATYEKTMLAHATLNNEGLQYAQSEYKNAMESALPVAQNITTALAEEYRDKGIKVGSGDNEAYQQALQKLYTYSYDSSNMINCVQYTGDVNVSEALNPQQTQYSSAISQTAQDVQNLSKWAVKKNRVSHVLYMNLGPEVKNEPVRKANRGLPQYRTWQDQDGSRVSEVQYRDVLDMNQPIIKQPSAQSAENNKTLAELLLEKTGRKDNRSDAPVSRITDAPVYVVKKINTR